jgi:SAM-dependent methyltransferase
MTTLKELVRDRYGELARSGLDADAAARRVAAAFGYTAEELGSIPAGANLGLSCGNPTATANLRPGETVIDLGAGGGLDVFLAARKVGPAGKAIGVDMTPDMVERARRNAEKAALTNVEFHLGEIESLPFESEIADCVVSNCVLNLVPDKERAFAEIFRVLKPGGRLAASDIALRRPLPPDVSRSVLATIGCVAGAVPIDDYRAQVERAGFQDVLILDAGVDLSVYFPPSGGDAAHDTAGGELRVFEAGCCSATPGDSMRETLADLMKRYDVNDYAASVKVFAIKPMRP